MLFRSCALLLDWARTKMVFAINRLLQPTQQESTLSSGFRLGLEVGKRRQNAGLPQVRNPVVNLLLIQSLARREFDKF